jgi:RNA polymerase sigma factor (sigma-70 family)
VPRKVNNPPDLSRETDANLLTMMTWCGRDDQAAREAWAEFYRRHAGYLYAVCLRAYRRLLGGEAGVEALVSDTFLAVFQRGAATFQACGSPDQETARRRVRAWLGQIARRLALLQLRQRRATTEDLAEAVSCRIPARTAAAQPVDGQAAQRVCRAMQKVLSERERDVLATRMQFYDPERNQQRMEPEVLRDLARRWQTTPENVRQVYHRALAKLRQALETREC